MGLDRARQSCARPTITNMKRWIGIFSLAESVGSVVVGQWMHWLYCVRDFKSMICILHTSRHKYWVHTDIETRHTSWGVGLTKMLRLKYYINPGPSTVCSLLLFCFNTKISWLLLLNNQKQAEIRVKNMVVVKTGSCGCQMARWLDEVGSQCTLAQQHLRVHCTDHRSDICGLQETSVTCTLKVFYKE